MAGFVFCIDENETKELIELILSDGGIFIPKTHYRKKEFEILNEYESIIRYVYQDLKTFFVLNSKYYRSPYEMDYVEADGGKYWALAYQEKKGEKIPIIAPSHDFWYIIQNNGGPDIEFKSPIFKEIDNMYNIIVGELVYTSKYWDTVRKEIMKIPDELIYLFNKYVKIIKSKTKPIKPITWENQRIWISKSFINKAKYEKKEIKIDNVIILDKNGNFNN